MLRRHGQEIERVDAARFRITDDALHELMSEAVLPPIGADGDGS